jgi:alkylated DNA repair dioxygenase AlkB
MSSQPLLFSENTDTNLLPCNGEVFFFPQFFSKKDSNALLQDLFANIPWKQEPIKIFGKEVMQPRLTAWYGDEGKAYSYSGITMQPLAWTNSLQQIKTAIEIKTGLLFNSALLNLYRDGKDSMGWHRDNEKELGPNPSIASVSFGGSRVFKLRDYNNKSSVLAIELTHGSLLLMKGATQHYWEHQVAKTSKQVAPRINITFRDIK